MSLESTTIPVRMGVIEHRADDQEQRLKEHGLFINGNGVVGAKVRLHALEKAYSETKTLIWWVIALLVSMLMSGGGVTIWFITSVLPVLYSHVGK